MKQLSIFSNNEDASSKSHWTLFIDGASRGNPGLAGAGVFLSKNDKVVAKNCYFLGVKTNNQAEYIALINGLAVLIEHKPQKQDNITIYSDSELLVRQIKGIYKIKHPDLKKLYDEAMKYLSSFQYTIQHVRREKNKVADSLANQALDQQTSICP